MGFSNQERINLVTKALAAGVLDANSVGQWYETLFLFGYTVGGRRVWTQMDDIEANPAANLAAAQALAVGALSGIIQDLSLAVDAVRLTELPGTNKSTWVSYNTFGDLSSGVQDNWVQPQQSPQATGIPSIGYAIRLFDGDPNVAGVEITTTAGTTGTGINKTVGWIWNYSNGMLLLSSDFYTETGITPSLFDPYVNGFPYTGTTASDVSTTVVREVPTPVTDGATTVFTLLNPAIVAGSERVYLNGIQQRSTGVAPDYAWVGPNQIDFAGLAGAPLGADTLEVTYQTP